MGGVLVDFIPLKVVQIQGDVPINVRVAPGPLFHVFYNSGHVSLHQVRGPEVITNEQEHECMMVVLPSYILASTLASTFIVRIKFNLALA